MVYGYGLNVFNKYPFTLDECKALLRAANYLPNTFFSNFVKEMFPVMPQIKGLNKAFDNYLRRIEQDESIIRAGELINTKSLNNYIINQLIPVMPAEQLLTIYNKTGSSTLKKAILIKYNELIDNNELTDELLIPEIKEWRANLKNNDKAVKQIRELENKELSLENTIYFYLLKEENFKPETRIMVKELLNNKREQVINLMESYAKQLELLLTMDVDVNHPLNYLEQLPAIQKVFEVNNILI